MRILVTGAAGMIGSSICRFLDEQERAYIPTDIRTDQRDLRELFQCQVMADDVDMIFDCAAPTRGIGSNDFLETSAIPVNLLSCKPKHYVYLSSSCVYPDAAPLPTTEDWGFSAWPESANQGYGWAKRMGELACKYSGSACTIVRPSNVYGPSYRWDQPIKHVIPSLIERMLAGENPLVVWGSGEQTRSFIYEDDCADLILRLSHHVGTFNIPGEEVPIKDLVDVIARTVGYIGKIEFDTTRPEGPKRKAQDWTNLRSVLPDWKSKVPVYEGLLRTVEAARAALRDNRVSVSTDRA